MRLPEPGAGAHRGSIPHNLRGLTAAALALVVTACATPLKDTGPPVFFPPAPELPRIQYLTSYSGSMDIEEQSSFNRFVVGKRQDLRLDKPYGVGIYDGKIYVCDTNASVVVFDLKRKTYEGLKGAVGPGKLIQPINISIMDDGTKYVSDPVRGQVVVFDRNDAYLKAYGSPGAWRPVDAVALEERVYVVDAESRLIKVFDGQSGAMIKAIGNQGEPSERLNRPTNLAFDRDGYLYVSDVGRFQIVKYDRDGHFRAAFGKAGDNLGHFARPKGIAIDHEGRLYAVDASFNNVQVFNEKGRLLMFFGQGGERPGDLLLPAKVSLDYDNVKLFEKYVHPGFQVEYLILVTSQFGERFVNVFAYGKEKGKRYPTEEELLKLLDERRQRELEKHPGQ